MAWSELLFPQHHILNAEWQLIKWETWAPAPLENSPLSLARGHAGSRRTLYRISPPEKAFVIFIVILLTQFPTQHRYTDWGPLDLWITKIPYKAIRGLGNFKARRPQGGRLSKDLVSVTFFFSPSLSFFLPAPGLEETQLKSSLPTNKFQPPRPL